MYRFGIWLMALALVFNGVAAYAWSDRSGLPATIAQDHHHEAALIDCDVDSGDAVAAAKCSDQTHGAMHDHLKCCVACNLVSLVPNVAAIPVAFSYTNTAFDAAQHELVGHLVALDPGIPKPLV